MAKNYENEIKVKREHGLEEYTYYLSDLGYNVLRKKTIEQIKAKKFGRHFNDEALHVSDRMQLFTEENDDILGFLYKCPNDSKK